MRFWLGVGWVSSLLLSGCMGMPAGTSTHISDGPSAVSTSGHWETRSTPRRQSRAQQTAPEPRPASRPAPSEASRPAPEVRTSPADDGDTRVKVMPADPQDGVPLREDNIEDSAPPVSGVSSPKPTPVVASAPQPAASAEPATAGSQHSESDRDDSQDTWLDRYPNLSQDLGQYQDRIVALETELKHYKRELASLQQQVAQQWGSGNVLTSGKKQFVKYSDNYKSRGDMDFTGGKVVVETVDQANPKARLKEAIVTTLLTPLNADDPNLFSDRRIDYDGPYLLSGQVKDQEGVPVKWPWRANRYAQWLVNHRVQQVEENGQLVYRVEIPLIDNHVQVRGHRYETLVRQASERYQISEPLIYAIMETESSFNPYATSHIPAYGLMQVVPATAGRDVFQRIKKRHDQPTRDYLFNPANNIDTGTAYLSILRDNYLNKIRNPTAREYAMISGYNGGAGNVLRTFSRNRTQAVEMINRLSPEQVYQKLRHDHPSSEARRYLEKVTTAKRHYQSGGQGPALASLH